MRNYEEEARSLELFYIANGILTPDIAGLSLLQLTDYYVAKRILEYTSKVDSSLTLIPTPVSAETVIEPEEAKPEPLKLSDDQARAWELIQAWSKSDSPYFVLRGYAGTGKTFLLRLLNTLGARCYFSAPTNKAAKVLGKSVGCLAKTTYSMLGLRMEQIEDKLVLTPSQNPPYFPRNSILVIDEASMCGKELCAAIEAARLRCNIKILYVGDPAQLPPVGEKRSKSWSVTKDENCRAELLQVMRNDNELLALATDIRECIANKDWDSPLHSNHTATSGVWKWKTQDQFERKLLEAVDNGFADTKLIAWRNKTVERYNRMIRRRMGFKDLYEVGDVLLLAEPIEKDGNLIAHTDDEYRVESIDKSCIRVGIKDIPTWQLEVDGDQRLILDIPVDPIDVELILNQKANIAKKLNGSARREAWADFWETKAMFHKVRYGYALTAHRAQGSTYTNVWVDQMDILSNHNKREAFRCLYVATTRPTTTLHSF